MNKGAVSLDQFTTMAEDIISDSQLTYATVFNITQFLKHFHTVGCPGYGSFISSWSNFSAGYSISREFRDGFLHNMCCFVDCYRSNEYMAHYLAWRNISGRGYTGCLGPGGWGSLQCHIRSWRIHRKTTQQSWTGTHVKIIDFIDWLILLIDKYNSGFCF